MVGRRDQSVTWGSPTTGRGVPRSRRRGTRPGTASPPGLPPGDSGPRSAQPQLPALAPQGEPAHDRDIVPRRDRRPAMRAARARPDHALLPGNPVDADVQEAPDDRADQEESQAEDDEHRPSREHDEHSGHPTDERTSERRQAVCLASKSRSRFRASSIRGSRRRRARGSLPSVSITASASLGVQRGADRQHLDDLVEGPGRRQGGPRGEAARGRPAGGGPARRDRPSARRRTRSRGAAAGWPRGAPRRRRWRGWRPGLSAASSARVRSSQSRKTGSPDSAKIARIDRPERASISRSASRNGRPRRSARIRPTVDLPVPR